MRLYLSEGSLMEITWLGNGDTEVNIICPPKTYYSFEEKMKDKQAIAQEALSVLRQKGIIGEDNKKQAKYRVPNMPAFQLVPRRGLDGRMQWVNEPTLHTPAAKKRHTPPHKKQPTENIGYTWNPTTDEMPAAAPPITTYGVTPTAEPSAPAQSTPQNTNYFDEMQNWLINKPDGNSVAPVYHPSMQTGAPTLRHIAEMAFPTNNDDKVTLSASLDAEYKVFSTDLIEQKLSPNNKQDEGINNTGSTTKRGGDIGIFGVSVSDSQKVIYISSNKISLRGGDGILYDVREHREFVSGGFLEIKGAVETREVWVGKQGGDFDTKVIYQYRTGIILSAGLKNETSGEIDIGPNLKFQANSDWTDVPISKYTPPLQTRPEFRPG
jgi:hypothetical protein